MEIAFGLFTVKCSGVEWAGFESNILSGRGTCRVIHALVRSSARVVLDAHTTDYPTEYPW